ncbi:MAG: hypothetical protein N5P05_002227 [Chroococcopsis gigantea SAG 12.99]|nr:hypothetical protein [Chroococcopsis gigantea SAG 12.99]
MLTYVISFNGALMMTTKDTANKPGRGLLNYNKALLNV